MKEWFYRLIVIGFFGVAVRLLLPAGEKSKLYPPLRFLISLLLITTIFLPCFQLLGQSGENFTSFFENITSPNTDEIERLLLERSAKEMTREVQTKFPEAKFTLYIYTDENALPTEIAVEGVEADRIADYIEVKYEIPAEEYKKGGNGNGTD